MSDLPKSWVEVEITEVLQLNNNGKPFQQGWSPRCNNHPAAFDDWGVLKTTAIQEGEFWEHENKHLPDDLEPKPNIEVRPGDILMTCAGPRSRCGVVCTVERTRPKLMMSGKMYRFRPQPNAMNTNYLSYFLRTREAQMAIDRMKTGISDSGLNLTHGRFAQLRVPLAPRKQQDRVVAAIEELFSELDKGVESLMTAQEQLKVYRQAVLKYAFVGKLTAQWRVENSCNLQSTRHLLAGIEKERETRYQKRLEEWKHAVSIWRANGEGGRKPTKPRQQKVEIPHDDDFSDLEKLPQEWGWVFLNQLSEHIVDGTHKTPVYQAEGVPFVSAKDVKNFRIDFSDTRYIDETQHEELTKRCLPRRGCVLITKSGTIGRVAAVETDARFSLFESVANVPTLPPVNAKYLAFACFHLIDTYFGARNQKGVAVRHLHLEDIRRLPVPLASPSEQNEIAERVDELWSQIDFQEDLIEQELARIEALRQSILKKAFSGQLVEPGPDDEPASVLLKRIKAEQTQVKKKNKRKDAA